MTANAAAPIKALFRPGFCEIGEVIKISSAATVASGMTMAWPQLGQATV
jgi:hypothetical protein